MRDAPTATCRPWRVRDVAKRGSRFVLHVRPRECTASGPAALRERQRPGGRGLARVCSKCPFSVTSFWALKSQAFLHHCFCLTYPCVPEKHCRMVPSVQDPYMMESG